MKRIIYTAVALILCASVFGIADYLNAKKKGALVNYTDDAHTTDAVITEKKPEITTTVKEEKSTSNTTKELKKESKPEKKIADKKVNTHYSEIIPNVVTEKTKDLATEKVDLNVVQQGKTTDVKNDSTIQDGNKRKISLELFSRAPIREKKIKGK